MTDIVASNGNMFNNNLVAGPIWVTIVVVCLSLVMKLFLYISSRWYRDWRVGNVLPNTLYVPYAYYNLQPTYDIGRGRSINRMANPIRYIFLYICSICACAYLIYGMNCSFKGGCQTYAWTYVFVIGVLFLFIMIRTLYEYVNWNKPAAKEINYVD